MRRRADELDRLLDVTSEQVGLAVDTGHAPQGGIDLVALVWRRLAAQTYYHHIRRRGGLALQRVYTDNRSLDETVAVSDGDAVLVPRDYRLVAAAPGYDDYYLSAMAGPQRAWRFTKDPDHGWIVGDHSQTRRSRSPSTPQKNRIGDDQACVTSG